MLSDTEKVNELVQELLRRVTNSSVGPTVKSISVTWVKTKQKKWDSCMEDYEVVGYDYKPNVIIEFHKPRYEKN